MKALLNHIPLFNTTIPFALGAAIGAGCASNAHQVSTRSEKTECGAIAATLSSSSSSQSSLALADADLESRIRIVAESDLPCDAQRAHVRQVTSPDDLEDGSRVRFYEAQRCGLSQVYRIRPNGEVQPEGVDVFLVSPPTLGTTHIVALPSYTSRAPSHSEALTLIDKQGIVCNASVGERVSDTAWKVEGCITKSPIPLGIVAIRASQGSPRTHLEFHSIGNHARIGHVQHAAPTAWDTTWEPSTIVDLTGDNKTQVALHCRRNAMPRECERFMVYRNSENDAPRFFLVSRGHWGTDPN